MEERCNQVPDCRDKTDVRGCKVIILKDGYNKNIPHIGRDNPCKCQHIQCYFYWKPKITVIIQMVYNSR